MAHTEALLEIPAEAFDVIAAKLKQDAGEMFPKYEMWDGDRRALSMTGIRLVRGATIEDDRVPTVVLDTVTYDQIVESFNRSQKLFVEARQCFYIEKTRYVRGTPISNSPGDHNG